MAGFGSEMLLFSALGFVVLGPKHMNRDLAKNRSSKGRTRQSTSRNQVPAYQ